MIHSSPNTIGHRQRFGRCCFKSNGAKPLRMREKTVSPTVTGDNAAAPYVDGSTGANCSFSSKNSRKTMAGDTTEFLINRQDRESYRV
jgi:hypothetical protein